MGIFGSGVEILFDPPSDSGAGDCFANVFVPPRLVGFVEAGSFIGVAPPMERDPPRLPGVFPAEFPNERTPDEGAEDGGGLTRGVEEGGGLMREVVEGGEMRGPDDGAETRGESEGADIGGAVTFGEERRKGRRNEGLGAEMRGDDLKPRNPENPPPPNRFALAGATTLAARRIRRIAPKSGPILFRRECDFTAIPPSLIRVRFARASA
jgi:hypothetical protein